MKSGLNANTVITPHNKIRQSKPLTYLIICNRSIFWGLRANMHFSEHIHDLIEHSAPHTHQAAKTLPSEPQLFTIHADNHIEASFAYIINHIEQEFYET